MNFWQFLQLNWSELLVLIGQHVKLVLIAILIAVVIGVPTGILLTRRRALRGPVVGIANIMQTIPSLALFGFLIPLPFIGGIGARTALVALVLYSLLPIIRNTITGILGVEPSVREAAVAMGMTDGQVLRQVELPLAMGVIVTGIRVATVIAVGVTTIAAAVGAGGLGVYIFRGLRQYDNNLLLAGALSAALLALVADFSLGLVERQFTSTVKRNGLLSVVVAAVLVVVTGVAIWQVSGNTDKTDNKVVIGSKDFTESALLAEIVAQLLEARGVAVERRFELGGNLPHEALVSGTLDLYPEYTGTSFTAILHHQPISDPRAVYDEVKKEYLQRFNIGVSAPIGFENTFAILVRGEESRRLNLKTISDAAPHTKNWRAGFGQDFMSRDDGYPGFSKTYGLNFAEVREMDLSLTYIALSSSQVDLIAANSTDGRIATLDLFQLADDRRYFPPYEAVYLVRQQALDRVPALREVLASLANAISTEEMRRLNYEIDGNRRDPKEVIREWIGGKR
ncbi:MAG: ABC transporter permease/substrate-binding protein [Acidobacteria bacterium]|nr:ABC transporter permease/substrate-binding protein [Acidobacteriota bacterium]MCA1627752.1 ABC transporter permease/substrate-binding protein [Acidobacteriota bacterium]